MAPKNTYRPSADNLKFVSRGARGQSVSDCNSQCLYAITTDVMIFIERWCVSTQHYRAVTGSVVLMSH